MKLIVCTPGASFDWRWKMCWTQLVVHFVNSGIEAPEVCGVSNNIYNVRNNCAERGLKIDYRADYWLWIDSDNLFTPEDFDTLATVAQGLDGRTAVGSAYLMDHDDGKPPLLAAGQLTETGPRPIIYDPTAQHIEQVGYIGFGFLLMPARMMNEMGMQAFNPVLAPRSDKGYLTDDLSFCWRAAQRGFKFFVHHGVYSEHLKLNPVKP